MKGASTYFLILVTLLTIEGHSLACTCFGPEGVEGNFQAVDAVFLGRVKDMRIDRENFNALFEVEKSWKGVDTDEILVQSPAGMCGYWFKEGESYVVYGNDNGSGGYTTNACFRMVRVSDASEDLTYFQA